MGKPASPATLAEASALKAQSDGVIREKSTGARSIIRSLEELGVDTVFGLPGGAILPTYDPLLDSQKVRHILVRHEQGAGHAAEGYAHATGKVGVCIATSGPGATNLTTPIYDAYMDSVPMLVITGQVGAALVGTDAFQEADIVGITMPISKHSFLVTDAKDIPARIAEAYELAQTGRPGPVIVDIAKSAQNAEEEFVWPPVRDLPGYRPVTKPNARQVREAARMIATAEKPVFYLGGGVIRAGAAEAVRELVKLTGIPAVTTLNAIGSLTHDDPHNLGMPGMHGTVAAVDSLQRSDLLITLGARFDDRVTGSLESFAPHAQVIHADIDPAEIGKNRHADVPIVGDVLETARELIEQMPAAYRQYGQRDISAWWRRLNRMRETYPLGWTPTEDGNMAPQYVLEQLAEIVGPDAIYVAGVGQHQMWASQFLKFDEPRTWINSGGAGTMGLSVPAAMGAKVARPDKVVWAIDGDGCFQMTNQELATCALNDIPIKVAVINNSSLGMVRQWQTLYYNERYSNTDLNTGLGTRNIPDFLKLADAYGCVGLRCERPEDVAETIRRAMEINDRPVVIDFQVSADAMVWPMVAAGVSNDEIQYARDIAPNWDDEE